LEMTKADVPEPDDTDDGTMRDCHELSFEDLAVTA
jgi:hypothetical protein